MGHIILIAFRNLLVSPLRTSILGFGIVLVTMLWVCLLYTSDAADE